MKNPMTIRALFAFPGFTAASKLVGVLGDRYARVIQLKRRKKQPFVRTVDTTAEGVTTKRYLRVRDLSVAGLRIYLDRALERQLEMAATGAVSEVCRTD